MLFANTHPPWASPKLMAQWAESPLADTHPSGGGAQDADQLFQEQSMQYTDPTWLPLLATG